MKPVVVLRNDPIVPPGHLANALARIGLDWDLARLDEGDALPSLDEVSAVVALGGSMGAYEEDRWPYLEDERRFLAACVDAAIPVLGICLGAQLLADSLGGEAYLADSPEAAFGPVHLTGDGAADPVTSRLDGRPVLRLHEDTWDLPPGATRLAGGGGYEQAFRLGSGLGIQPHPEASPQILAAWLSHGGARLARAAGTDPDELHAAMTASHAEVEETAARFFAAWVKDAYPGL